MKRIFTLIFYCASVLLCVGRELHYRPDNKGGVVCVNGATKFNRGLYGAHSGFRLECSDMPEFGIYLPRMGGNLKFELPYGDCTATYTPGKMEYHQSNIEIQAQVGRSEDLAIWRIVNHSASPQEFALTFGCASDKRFSRDGDLGVDPPDCFALNPAGCEGNVYEWISPDRMTVEYGQEERKKITLTLPKGDWKIQEAHPTKTNIGAALTAPYINGKIQITDTIYLAYFPPSTEAQPYHTLPTLFAQCEQERASLANSVKIDTPDEWINPIGSALAIAADGIWSGETWLHGAIGWRTQHLGWRGAYAGTALGLYDRARKHFETYSANQVSDVPQIYDHPRQDSALNLARAEKRWGTPMYSNGYICRKPGKKDEMSHYDMNLVYIDALIRYLVAIGDTCVIRQFLPTITRHLDWEKRNFDPDDDGLYDAYACIWASDALYYSGGAVTHSSAYNCKAYKDLSFWLKDLFWLQNLRQCDDLVSYQSFLMNNAQLYENLFPNPEEFIKTYRAIMDTLWLPDHGHWAEFKDRLGNRRTHNYPGLWTIYHAIDSDIGSKFQKYTATCYIDREIPHIPVIVEDDSISYHTLASTPWTPYAWSINNVAIAEVMHTALAFWQANRNEEAFRLMKSVAMDNMYTGSSPLNFGQISQYDAARGECYRDFADPIGVWSRALVEGLFGIKVEKAKMQTTIEPGFPSDWDHASISLPHISYSFCREGDIDKYEIDYPINSDNKLNLIAPLCGPIKTVRINGEETNYYHETTDYINSAKVIITIDSIVMNLPIEIEIEREREFLPKDAGYAHSEGPFHFRKVYDGFSDWWIVDSISSIPTLNVPRNGFDHINYEKLDTVNLSGHYNAIVADIFKNKYISPRPDVTTLQIPINGIGEWCHPLDSADIYDSCHKNIIFTSLWDNYPDSASVPLTGKATNAYIVVAGSTNHMQCLIPNAQITIRYADGTSDATDIIPPYNYAPIEQDYFFDGKAFSLPTGLLPPLRIPLDGSEMRRSFDFKEVYGRRIPGGAGVAIDIPVNPKKDLDSLTLECLSNDIVIGIMNITLQRP